MLKKKIEKKMSSKDTKGKCFFLTKYSAKCLKKLTRSNTWKFIT